jgi:hypothetical protein
MTIRIFQDEESQGVVERGEHEVICIEAEHKKKKNPLPDHPFNEYLALTFKVTDKEIYFTGVYSLMPGPKFQDTIQVLQRLGCDITKGTLEISDIENKKAKFYLGVGTGQFGKTENKIIL